MFEFSPDAVFSLPTFPVARPPDFTNSAYLKRRALVAFIYNLEYVRPNDMFRIAVAVHAKYTSQSFEEAVEDVTSMLNSYGKAWTCWQLGLQPRFRFPHYEPTGELIPTTCAWIPIDGKPVLHKVPLSHNIRSRVSRKSLRLRRPIKPFKIKALSRKRAKKIDKSK